MRNGLPEWSPDNPDFTPYEEEEEDFEIEEDEEEDE